MIADLQGQGVKGKQVQILYDLVTVIAEHIVKMSLVKPGRRWYVWMLQPGNLPLSLVQRSRGIGRTDKGRKLLSVLVSVIVIKCSEGQFYFREERTKWKTKNKTKNTTKKYFWS